MAPVVSAQLVSHAAGTVIEGGKYKILAVLGEGGMGVVYRAHHMMLNKDVALKTFRSAALDEESALRFQREAKAVARLDQVNIVRVFDFGQTEAGIPYYTMELLAGHSLAQQLALHGPMTAAKALPIFIQTAKGLAAAHARGIIHRDLKPGNIFLVDEGKKGPTVKLVDFGIASLTAGETAQKITTYGAIVGTPLYMSPEQSVGKPVTERSDIYSLGCSLFETLTGRPPFKGETAVATLLLHHDAPAPTLAQAGGETFAPALEACLARMLAKAPEARYGSAEELVRIFERLLANSGRAKTSTPGENAQEPSDTDESLAAKKASFPAYIAAALVLCTAAGLSLVFAPHPIKQTPALKVALSGDLTALPDNIDSERVRLKKVAHVEPGEVSNIGGQKTAIMHCPTNFDFGGMSVEKDERKIENEDGELHWSISDGACFNPSELFVGDLANFKMLPDNSIKDIHFDFMPADRYMPALQKILLSQAQTLENLRFAHGRTDRDFFKGLQKLNLKGLHVKRPMVDGRTFAAMMPIRTYWEVGFDEGENASAVVKALKGSPYLNFLSLTKDKLSKEDFAIIGALPDLNELFLASTGVTDADIAALGNLTKLTKLDLTDAELTARSLPTLKKLGHNSLKELIIPGKNLSALEKSELMRSVPRVRFQ